jgi:hypothetical protein
MTITRQLSPEELTRVSMVLGKTVPVLFAPALDVDWPLVAARSYSIPLGPDEYLVIASDWDDTPETAIDYHTMEVEILDHPKGVAAINKVCRVNIDPPPSPVVEVMILEREAARGSESVLYDSALVFTLADERRFAIGAHQSIAGGVDCLLAPIALDALFEDCKVREVLRP